MVVLINSLKYTTYGTNLALVGTNKTDAHNAYDTSPTTIDIPSTISVNGVSYTVEEIGQFAFYSCEGIQSLKLPSTIKQINRYAFDLMHLSINFDLPESLLIVCEWALSSSEYSSIYIPKNVKSIGIGAFAYTIKVKSYDVHPENKFYCNDENGVLYDKYKTKVIQVPSCLTSFDIPATVTSLCQCAFIQSNIKTLTIPALVSLITYRCFDYTNIVNITFVGNPKIESDAFKYSYSLKYINYYGEKAYKGTMTETSPTVYTCIGYKSNYFSNIAVKERTDCIANKQPKVKTCRKTRRSIPNLSVSLLIVLLS